MSDSWRSIAARKAAERDSRIPDDWRLQASQIASCGKSVLDVKRFGILSDLELEITSDYDAASLLDDLATGKRRSVDVVTAFSKRAAIATQLVNCCTELLFDDALARARKLDDHFARTGETIGPLHGCEYALERMPHWHIAVNTDCWSMA